MKRTTEDISMIRILTQIQGVSGWVVEIKYKDGKFATFSVDWGKLDGAGMLDEVTSSIKKQLKG